MSDIIKIVNISKVYAIGQERVVALRDVSLNIGEGEFCCIVGTSGSGKSTLLHMIAGLDKPTRGDVYIDGQCINRMSENKLARFRQERIGFIFQSYNLLPTLTARENVALPLAFRGMPKYERDLRALKLLKSVGLETHVKHKPTQMSGGQQQRVGIARAFIGQPKIVFADEPTGNLDSKTREEVMKLMIDISRRGRRALVMVTHDKDLAKYADRIINISDGRITDIVDNHTGMVENRMDLIDNRTSTVESRMDLFDNRTSLVESRMDLFDNRTSTAESRMELNDNRTSLVESRMGLFDNRTSLVESRMGLFDNRTDA